MNEVNLSKVLIRDTVLLDVEPFTDKETMFETLAAKFEAAGIVTDAKQYIKALEQRETLGSTYMGNMIALPHGKCDAVLLQHRICHAAVQSCFPYRWNPGFPFPPAL